QIVANLVENALKYARTRVTVGLSSDNGTLELRVDDDGPGIDAGDLPHVFDRLYTSRPAPGRKVGTGLGLAIVHELSAAMGGTAPPHPLGVRAPRVCAGTPPASWCGGGARAAEHVQAVGGAEPRGVDHDGAVVTLERPPGDDRCHGQVGDDEPLQPALAHDGH